MPRARTVSLRQLDVFLKLMESNLDMVNSQRLANGTNNHQQTRRFWVSVTEELNRLPAGTVKRPNQWKSYWHDLKYRARKRASELRALAAAGQPPAAGAAGAARALTATERRVLRIAGVIEHSTHPIALEEMLPWAADGGASLATWIEKKSPPGSAAGSPRGAHPPPAPPPDLDPLCDSDETARSRSSPARSDSPRAAPAAGAGTPRQRRPRPPAARGDSRAAVTRTQDRIARTQDTIARSQDRIAHTQERIARNQERIARAYDRIATVLEAMAPQVDRVPPLLEELVQISRRMFDNEE